MYLIHISHSVGLPADFDIPQLLSDLVTLRGAVKAQDKRIHELDERITALERSGSDEEWCDADA